MRRHANSLVAIELRRCPELAYDRSMTTMNIHEARAHFSQLLEAVGRGEEVIIARSGVPVARIIPEPERPVERHKVRLGLFADQVKVVDPDWHLPMSDDDIREMFGDEFVDG